MFTYLCLYSVLISLHWYILHVDETEFLNPPKPRPVTPPTTSDPPLDNPISFKEEVFYLTIPVSPVTYIGTLIGTNGRHLKALCSQYKIESIHLGEHPLKPKQIGSAPRRIRRPRNTAGMVSLFISSPVKVVILFNPANEDISMKFKDALKERVQKVCQERKKHFETVCKVTTTIPVVKWMNYVCMCMFV